MGEVTVMFTLPDDAFAALQAKARAEGLAPGAILRAALGRDLNAPARQVRQGRHDPVFVGAIRTLLARDIVEANSWSDLATRLWARGYDLRLSDGRLSLFGRDTMECLVDATEIGASYGALMRRFGGPIPGQRAG